MVCMLNICSTVATEINLTFNLTDLHIYHLDRRLGVAYMYLCGNSVGCTNYFKYLSVTILSGRKFGSTVLKQRNNRLNKRM